MAMNDIDVTEFIPEMLDRLTPEERAKRAARAAEIAQTDFSQSGLFGSGLDTIGRTLRGWLGALLGRDGNR